jgi:glycosyltransferase involved in cell wall biosynthesis
MQQNHVGMGRASIDGLPESPSDPPRVSLVIPCFNEEAVLPETMNRLGDLLATLTDAGKVAPTSRIVFVDDGSRDDTWSIIEQSSKRDGRITGIKLSRNQGHQNALLAGLFTADGDVLISLDADLQDDIRAIPKMIDEYDRGCDIVYGVRSDRSNDGRFKRATARCFYGLMRWLGAESVSNHADFRLMSRRAIEALKLFGEVNLFLRGIVPLVGFRSAIVTYERQARFAGTTKYPFAKMLALALEAITSFSVVPLRLITLIGFFVFSFSAMMVAWTLWVRFFTNEAVPGWTSTTLPIYLLGGLQILCLGVIGEYLGKLYQEAKRRPRYIIERCL